MRFHNLWIFVALAVAIHSLIVDLSALGSIGVFLFYCFCVLFWYLGEIRALLQDLTTDN